MLSFQMKLQPTTPSLVSSMMRWLHFNVTQVLFFCPIHCTEPRVQHKHYRREKKQQKGKLKLKKKSVATSSHPSAIFCPTASGDSSQLLNPATSALISGVVILGGVSAGFCLLSFRLLQKLRRQPTAASGVWNPGFKWTTVSSTIVTSLVFSWICLCFFLKKPTVCLLIFCVHIIMLCHIRCYSLPLFYQSWLLFFMCAEILHS